MLQEKKNTQSACATQLHRTINVLKIKIKDENDENSFNNHLHRRAIMWSVDENTHKHRREEQGEGLKQVSCATYSSTEPATGLRDRFRA